MVGMRVRGPTAATSPDVMRSVRASWLLLAAVGCGHDRAAPLPGQSVLPPAAPPSTALVPSRSSPTLEPATPPPAEAEIYTSDGRTSDPHITNHVDARQAGPILTSLFRTHLTDLKRCPRPFFVPQTWSQIDQLQDENMAAGRFVPVVEQRLDASFTAPGASESLFVVDVLNCQANTIGHRVLAIFPTDTLGLPKATLRWDDYDYHHDEGVFVAVLQEVGKPARLLETRGRGARLVELNRDFVPGASGTSSHDLAGPGGEATVQPWREIEELEAPPGDGCFAFAVSLAEADRLEQRTADHPTAASGTVHVGPCRSP